MRRSQRASSCGGGRTEQTGEKSLDGRDEPFGASHDLRSGYSNVTSARSRRPATGEQVDIM